MSLYYVYMKWYRPSMELTNWAGRQLLTCESRYAADEFFRELQTVSGAQGRRFTLLERVTPQFWRYDTEAGPETAIIDTLRFNAISDASKGAIMVTHLWNTADRNWVIARPSQVLIGYSIVRISFVIYGSRSYTGFIQDRGGSSHHVPKRQSSTSRVRQHSRRNHPSYDPTV